MKKHPVYVDFDDVIAGSTEYVVDYINKVHGIDFKIENLVSFDMNLHMGLNEDEFWKAMHICHEAEATKKIKPIEGALEGLKTVSSKGYIINIVTGRPEWTRSFVEKWLNDHGVKYDKIVFIDKYNRHEGEGVLRLDDVKKMNFSFAVEDSLSTALFLKKNFSDLPVFLLDKPWNRAERADDSLSNELIVCRDWDMIFDTI